MPYLPLGEMSTELEGPPPTGVGVPLKLLYDFACVKIKKMESRALSGPIIRANPASGDIATSPTNFGIPVALCRFQYPIS